MTRRAALLTATAAVALTFGSFPLYAAMPVTGLATAGAGSDIVQVQATPPATGAPPAAAAPAATTTAPAATTTAPAATTTAPAATTTTTTPDATTAPTGGKKARAKKTASRQKEIDTSVQSGTVPKRYMRNVPKQYHDLIPWAK